MIDAATDIKVPDFKVPQASNPTESVNVPFQPTTATRILEPLVDPKNVEPPPVQRETK